MLSTLRPLMPAIAGFLAFFGVLLAVLGAAFPSRDDPIGRRLNDATKRARTIDDIELQAPFVERVFKPVASQLSKIIVRLTPAGVMEGTQKKLMYAGLSNQMQVSDFMGVRGLAVLISAALAVTIGVKTGASTVALLLILLIVGGLAYMLPDLWVRGKITQRKDQVQRALPDAIDLLTISVEAGLGFDLALARVVQKSDNALTREFGRVIQEMRIGIARRDALRAMVERTGVDDLSAFISAIIQAEQLGASIANVLRIQSVEMRVRRRQHAETLAHQAPIKMLFPMAFLIFPPIFIVVLGPAIPNLIHQFAPNVYL
ncbi:MAG TPA: type II secretion system F family protein [Ktedonobacterales bacterium]|nr:type II secretion system F family protein [Ktedonobacterales bacterium]